jgi:dTDP-4-dehydrorhamnose 3,5-epimerase
MIVSPTPLQGAFLIDVERREDERGFFARTFCVDELGSLDARNIQSSISFNPRRGTLRGMHFQRAPHEETKIVRCTRGAIFDVIIDLRRESATFKKWFGARLDQDNHGSLYIPKGFAHGLLTLAADTEVLYMMADPFVSEAASGVRWDDPAFGISWPEKPSLISDRDASYPDFV